MPPRRLLCYLPSVSGIHQVEIRHDDECQIFDGHPCDCGSEVKSGVSVDQKYRGDR